MPTSLSNGKISYATRWKNPLAVGFWKGDTNFIAPDYAVATLNAAPGIAIYDYTNNAKVIGHPTFTQQTTAASFSQDGTLLAVGETIGAPQTDGKLRLFNVSDWSEITIPEFRAVIGDIAINENNDTIYFSTNGYNGESNFAAIEKVGGVWVRKTMPSPTMTVLTQATPLKFNADKTKIYFGAIVTDNSFWRYDVNSGLIDATSSPIGAKCGNYNAVNVNGNGDVAGTNQQGSSQNYGVLNSSLTSLKFGWSSFGIAFLSYNYLGNKLFMLVAGQIRAYEVDNYSNIVNSIGAPAAGTGVCLKNEGKLIFVTTNDWYVYDDELNLIHTLNDSDLSGYYRISAIKGMF